MTCFQLYDSDSLVVFYLVFEFWSFIIVQSCLLMSLLISFLLICFYAGLFHYISIANEANDSFVFLEILTFVST